MRIRNSILVLALSLGIAPGPSFIPELDGVSVNSHAPSFEPAPAASRRLKSPIPEDLGRLIVDHYTGAPTARVHVQLDRPLYRPGEDVWFKTWALHSANLQAVPGQVSAQLLDPSGAVVATRFVDARNGATGDFTLPATAPGGRWTLKTTYGTVVDEHAFVVSNYQAPAIAKTLDFVREAYGPGDTVEALVELTHGIKGPLKNKAVRAMLTVDGVTVLDTPLKTDASGAVFVRGKLPATLSQGDGLLTVLVEEGGVSESISRSVPIVLAQVDLAFYPEGGDLRQGLQSRVYFEAKDQKGEPADIEGYIVDDRGSRVADFSSVHDGLGRFTFVPSKGRRYSARITAPAGIDAAIPLPAASAEGCTVRSYDDFDSTHDAVRVGVRCTTPQDVYVVGLQRDSLIDAAAVHAGPDTEAVVYLDGEATTAQGALRVTVFDAKKTPLAERLVYRGAGRDLQIQVKPDRDDYGPRDQVKLSVTTLDADGKPVAAELALAVVDDAVVSLADDEEGHILSRLYLDPELTDTPDDPAWYFDADEPDAREGLDLVMGTRGWRRFDWEPVFNPPQPERFYRGGGGGPGMPPMAMGVPMRELEREMVPMAPPMDDKAIGGLGAVEQAEPVVRAQLAAAEAPLEDMKRERAPRARQAMGRAEADVLWEVAERPMVVARVFPAPDYKAGFTGVRSDFRDTVHWAPTVKTDAKGKAEVAFYLSDAVTTFRVTAEGVGGGQVGHGEQTLTSVLPVSVAAKIPAVVSAGDRIDLPLTVTSTRDSSMQVGVTATLDGKLVTAVNRTGSVNLKANGGGTVWMPLEVGVGQDRVGLEIVAEGGGMTDTLQRSIEVVQPGFPRTWTQSGELKERQQLTFVLEPHQVGSLHASVVLHPGPTSSLVEGLEGLIRTPGGCFEQTSSTNWPNVAILNYLEQHEGNDRLRAKSAEALNVGYGRLSGFQVDAGGFETFGSGPGKEVLSAFGLLQFSDMKKLYPVSETMLKQDADFLLSRRDGSGGYQNSGDSAHGYGSAPKPVSDGFITYALVAAGHQDVLKKEIAAQATVAKTSKDPYVLALAARTLVNTNHPGAADALKRLGALQGADGGFKGAESSITRSYEANLDVESTALASLALMEAGPAHRAQFEKGIAWLIGARTGGTWGATQATAMALQALTKHAELSKAPRSPGDFFVEVNGKQVGRVHYDADQTDSIALEGLEEHLKVGRNTIVLHLDAQAPLPFALQADWTSVTPITDPGAELTVTTKLARESLKMGETVRLTASVSNQTDRIVPSPIARIGIPAGLEAPLWQLKELQDRGIIAFYETRPREVTLYWEGIHPNEIHTVGLDLEALVPGSYTAPASSAYPYYNDDEKGWAEGTYVEIARP